MHKQLQRALGFTSVERMELRNLLNGVTSGNTLKLKVTYNPFTTHLTFTEIVGTLEYMARGTLPETNIAPEKW